MSSQEKQTNKEHIKYIELNNYRCFKNECIGPFSRFNLIFGPNGSGKTCLLESIELAVLRRTSRLKKRSYEEIKDIVKNKFPAAPETDLCCKLLNADKEPLFLFPQTASKCDCHFKKLELYEHYKVSEEKNDDKKENNEIIAKRVKRMCSILDKNHFLNFETTIHFLEARSSEKLFEAMYSAIFGSDLFEDWEHIKNAKKIVRTEVIEKIIDNFLRPNTAELRHTIEKVLDNEIVSFFNNEQKAEETETRLFELLNQDEKQRVSKLPRQDKEQRIAFVEKRRYLYEYIFEYLPEYPTKIKEDGVENTKEKVEKKIQSQGDDFQQYDLKRYSDLLEESKKHFSKIKTDIDAKLKALNDNSFDPLNKYAREIVKLRIKVLQDLINNPEQTDQPQNPENSFQKQLKQCIKEFCDTKNELGASEKKLSGALSPKRGLNVKSIEIMSLAREWHKIHNIKLVQVQNGKFIENFPQPFCDIYKKLHHPSDFDKVRFHEVNRENGAKPKELCLQVRWKISKKWNEAAHVMSAGQRSALAMSVIFMLNLQYSEGLPYLILDEPLHNLDQLSLLSCLDLLREYLERYPEKQIFLSTADREVQGMARHKFGYLGEEEEFVDVKLSRIPGQAAEVSCTRWPN